MIQILFVLALAYSTKVCCFAKKKKQKIIYLPSKVSTSVVPSTDSQLYAELLAKQERYDALLAEHGEREDDLGFGCCCWRPICRTLSKTCAALLYTCKVLTIFAICMLLLIPAASSIVYVAKNVGIDLSFLVSMFTPMGRGVCIDVDEPRYAFSHAK